MLKNSENGRSAKSRIRTLNVTQAGSRHDNAYARATRSKACSSAEPLPEKMVHRVEISDRLVVL
jgi:hypothetical protein